MSCYNGEYEKEFRPFIDAMRYKAWRNRHKGRWESLSLQDTLKLLRQEVDELEEAIAGGNTIEILLESADVGVFAMIASSIAIKLAHEGGDIHTSQSVELPTSKPPRHAVAGNIDDHVAEHTGSIVRHGSGV